MTIINRTKTAGREFRAVRAIVLDAINPHEAHAAHHFAHPNAARVWRGRC